MIDLAKTNAKNFALEHEQGKIDYNLDHHVVEKEGKVEGATTEIAKEGEQLEEGEETNETKGVGADKSEQKQKETEEDGTGVNDKEADGVASKDKEKETEETKADDKGEAPRLISTKPANPRKLDKLGLVLSLANVAPVKRVTETYVDLHLRGNRQIHGRLLIANFQVGQHTLHQKHSTVSYTRGTKGSV